MDLLEDTLRRITPVNRNLEPIVRSRLDNLTKPPGSLGYLEDIAVRYCLAVGTEKPIVERKKIFVFAGDHGVADEGVSAYPQKVTSQMVRNMIRGGAAINVFSRHAEVEVSVVDVGVDDEIFENSSLGFISRKIRKGTRNITQGPAMTLQEAKKAIEVGVELAIQSTREGVSLLGTGDMGIANTTSSSAIFASLLPSSVRDVVGRGTGIGDEVLEHKISVVERALQVNRKNLSTPLGVLAALGGFEIAGICGLILGAASCRTPVVVDGFISSAGALLAMRMCPFIKDYLFYSHISAEKGHALFLERMGSRPILDLDMRLGEGTAASLAMFIVEASIKIYNEMATFHSAGVSTKRDG